MKIILASSSPRRKELLDRAGIKFEAVNPPDSAETPISKRSTDNPKEFARQNACQKAAAAAAISDAGSLIIGADTIVVCDGRIMGKPADKSEACEMLSFLSGKIHEVITGVAVLEKDTGRIESAAESTEVSFKNLTEAEIREYAESGEPLGKAGAYAIQGKGSIFIPSIKGCFFNVVGLPLFRTKELLSKFPEK